MGFNTRERERVTEDKEGKGWRKEGREGGALKSDDQ